MNEAILNKIQRCLALADSANPSEAAIALRQAKALMDKHNITDSDVLLVDVEEKSIEATTKAKPADWVQNLHAVVAQAFDCEAITTSFGGYHRCELKFIGVAPSSTIAAYTFEVLYRQLKKQRQAFIKEKLARFTTNKTKMADAFCVGWVRQVSAKCASLSPDPKIKQKIDAYLDKEFGELKESTSNINKYRNNTSALTAMQLGYKAAEEVALYVPVDGEEHIRIGGTA